MRFSPSGGPGTPREGPGPIPIHFWGYVGSFPPLFENFHPRPPSPRPLGGGKTGHFGRFSTETSKITIFLTKKSKKVEKVFCCPQKVECPTKIWVDFEHVITEFGPKPDLVHFVLLHREQEKKPAWVLNRFGVVTGSEHS